MTTRFIKLIFLLLLVSGEAFAKHYLTLVGITKDEHDYLEEWISYHHYVGVDHFIIYDNNDDDKTAKVLSPYEENGLVTRIPWKNTTPEVPFCYGCQVLAYQDAIARCQGETTWLAVLDTDEFLVPMKGRRVSSILKKFYSHADAIYVNWRVFGTGHTSLKPKRWLTLRLFECSPQSHPINEYGKSIFRPEAAISMTDPHFIITQSQYYNGSNQARGCETHCSGGIHTDYLRINHYVYRDEKFLREVKAKRFGVGLEPYLKLNEEYCQEKDYQILKVMKLHPFF